ncbi:ester cyclase [Cellulosimicrobium marinum]|uniref:ester cyclase n=1 Tax=Cellulosimicrobium marinum TaxID=1638992 RepID=UPI001E5C30DC|nr:ester cyclase [Cellulosimicrobium marinum]MCB7138016.1 ester cyclase [Cellulosimicrobium marinum]
MRARPFAPVPTPGVPAVGANKAAAIAVHTQAIPGNHADALATLLAPGFHDHDPVLGEGGAEALVAATHRYSDAFSDQRVDVLHAVAEGDLVALHVELSGRHTGFFRGVAPTGLPFRVREMHLLRFDAGRVVDHWCVRDEDALARTLAQGATVAAGAR